MTETEKIATLHKPALFVNEVATESAIKRLRAEDEFGWTFKAYPTGGGGWFISAFDLRGRFLGHL